ncbi:undecaprenyl-phosphate 4-deoxy-4-formamido-L-arabinose transferase [Geodermatophilus obscurus DSM 43160]|uniref:Glycosyl transferase family 2 n=1 Tax=Geodermatophilus obscurus (strain ATCC 25078 / DSM 43160 / JCM 3152 / CCUG 61914 / KCC A-0152 / KCTC 9177 / NBRC 13315 / NRRL B-3577 / G-20) TaxID=526225 RepID=D2S569_GEOOG|nr:glycosyl transferase family 2 [Geodermatophilus obscurus DSM 43160]
MPNVTPVLPVSVVMPVRNGARFLDEAIGSVLAQTYTHVELVVVDDGSIDGSAFLLESWRRRDSRVRVVARPEPGGIARALNDGVHRSTGDLLARLDADDRAAPDRIRQQVEQFCARPRLGLLGTGVRYLDEASRVIGTDAAATGPTAAQGLHRGNPFFHPSVMMRRSHYEAAGGYRPQVEPAEDLDLWLRISERFEVDNLKEPLTDYRIHREQSSLQRAAAQAVATAAAHWAADVRATGATDPLAGLQVVDEKLLLSLGLSSSALLQEQIAVHRWAAELCEMAGYKREALVAWQAALAAAASLDRTEAARLLLLRARLRRAQGRLVARRVDQLRALALAPRLATTGLVQKLHAAGRPGSRTGHE